MKFAHSDISGVFLPGRSFVPTLVIENQSLLRRVLKDVYLSLDGAETDAVLSVDNKPVEFSRYAELITDFIHFDLNQRPLINKICAALERVSLSAENYLETQRLLADIENKIGEWAFEFPCDIVAAKISVGSLLKAAGIELGDDYPGDAGDAERLIDYMELVREFDRDKLFITVNMRSFFPDEQIEGFMQTVVSHGYKVLMIESQSHPLLAPEQRRTVDGDLCEF